MLASSKGGLLAYSHEPFMSLTAHRKIPEKSSSPKRANSGKTST